MTTRDDIRRAHAFHRLRVLEVRDETHDTASFVLGVPDDLADVYAFTAGQFLTFRITVGDEELLRCYSMSSAPADGELTVTVKRVADGRVSNWLHDNVAAGTELEVAPPGGVFVLQDRDTPLLLCCGGSGVTPIMSIAKTALATTDRPVRVLFANRDEQSIIFRATWDALVAEYPDRLSVTHHLDDVGGYLGADDIRAFVGPDDDADVYLCGPTPFMDLVEGTLHFEGFPPSHVFVERFVNDSSVLPDVSLPPDGGDTTKTVTIVLKGKRHDIEYQPGDTILETSRRGGLTAPFSCEAGNCATCMAIVHEGSATMRVNNALTPDEVAEGIVLTCQALPEGDHVVVEYEDF